MFTAASHIHIKKLHAWYDQLSIADKSKWVAQECKRGRHPEATLEEAINCSNNSNGGDKEVLEAEEGITVINGERLLDQLEQPLPMEIKEHIDPIFQEPMCEE